MNFKKTLTGLPLVAVITIPTIQSGIVIAQEDFTIDRESLFTEATALMEETIVVGRTRSAASNIVLERMVSESSTDIIGADQISRVGDSSVATALRRVPGVTLVDGKFIYVRGLGERYSSTQLNGAEVPSPDLTRSVLPLDLFPTAIVESLAVQKTYSADKPIAFGGGNVDIRTKSVPDELLFNIEIGSKHNFATSGGGLTARGGSDDRFGVDDGTRELSSAVEEALFSSPGGIGPFAVSEELRRQAGARQPGDAFGIAPEAFEQVLSQEDAFAQAVEFNQDLAVALNRDIDIVEGSTDPTIGAEVNFGNNFLFDNGYEFGFLSGLSYDHAFDTVDSITRDFQDSDETVSFREETNRNVNITANLGFGLILNDDNELSTLTLFVRDTEEDILRENVFGENDMLSEGSGIETAGLRFEQRELFVNQLAGSHRWTEDTKSLIGLNPDLFNGLDQLEFEWYYSNSRATTDIPGETNVQFRTQSDPITGEAIDRFLNINESTVEYRFTNLDDRVESYGYELMFPLEEDQFTVDFSFGWDYVRKARSFRQLDLNLGSTNAALTNTISPNATVVDVFSDENIRNEALGISLNVNEANQRSYIAAVINASLYGKADFNWDETWRVVLGVRREDYQQIGIPFEPLNFEEQITSDRDELESLVFSENEYYPSVDIIYSTPYFGAETYQLRFSFSETIVRPDLREITPTSYLDPLNSNLFVEGNTEVRPSDLENLDLRSEWFFSNGDNLTLSLFYKDIENPIELFTSPTSDVGFSATIGNAASADIVGFEVEFLKELSSLGDFFTPFYLSGNVTISDSEVDGSTALAFGSSPTNPVRPLTAAAPEAANIQLGFDSDDGKHAATLSYNVFGERLRAVGINNAPDTFEQPFNSLDLTYSYFPTYSTTVKLRLQNLLSEDEVWEQGGTEVFVREVGLRAALDFKWQY